jgi:hypothetical protein
MIHIHNRRQKKKKNAVVLYQKAEMSFPFCIKKKTMPRFFFKNIISGVFLLLYAQSFFIKMIHLLQQLSSMSIIF